MLIESDNAGVGHKLLLVLGHHVPVESKVVSALSKVLGFHVSVESDQGVCPKVVLVLGHHVSVDNNRSRVESF